jgi:hypothetical protein
MTRLARIGIVLTLLLGAGPALLAQTPPSDEILQGPWMSPPGQSASPPPIVTGIPVTSPEAPSIASPPLSSSAAPALAVPEGLGFPNLLGGASAVPRASYQVRWFPEADVHGQTSSLGWVSQDLRAGTPIWVGDKSVLSVNAGVSSQVFQGSAVLPLSGTAISDTLWNVRVGVGYQQTFANEWTMGLSANLVSASDRPFASIDEIKFGVQGMLRIPVYEHDAYSPTSQLPFPIPGVAYQWVPSEQFQMLIGLPTAILYRPTEDLSFSLMWLPITNVRARATYRILPGVRIYLAYEAANESYYLADRTDDQDRLSEYDQRVSAGLQYSPAPCFSADLFAGYSFDRYFFMGRNLSDRSDNHFDLSDVPFFGAQVTIRW